MAGPKVNGEIAGWFDAHAPAIAVYASRRVGSVIARDVVAETFRIAIERFDDYDEGRHGERAWLFGIATNVIRHHWRSEQRRLRAHAKLIVRDVALGDPLLHVEEAFDARLRYERLTEAVLALRPDDRDLLMLTVWERMTSREAAAALGIQPGTVRSRLHRIRTELAEGTRDG